MSGGSLDYFSYRFDVPLEKISKEIKWGKNKWTHETLLEFQNAVKYMKLAQIYSRRVECLLGWDEEEDSFIENLKEELLEFNNNPEILEPQLQKCILCKNFNGKECKNRWLFKYEYLDHPEWELIEKEKYEKRIEDASDCWDFEEIIEEDEKF